MIHNPETCTDCKKKEQSVNAYWKNIDTRAFDRREFKRIVL